ncbi:MAG TPA: imidazoleglycerol-phosphate dehydratase HisB [Syntrophorhabdaceae bacterium]|jgi:imidazoleglycerol-phosphate dehydratase
MAKARQAKVERQTKETDIKIKLTVDGEGMGDSCTAIPFFDHMLNLFARHGMFDLSVEAKGDLDVDTHHTVEDVGIVMGKALKEAIGSAEGLRRYGHAIVPMDESLAMVAIDMSGRPAFVWNGELQGRIAMFDLEVVKEFFKGFVGEARCALHVNVLYGDNLHHKVEAVFKGFGKALKEAVTRDERIKGVLSTKGML